MTARDLIELSLHNLYRVRLRTTLTISGVVIAIAAFVAMLSFGAGNEKYVSDLYHSLGLLTSMNVYPKVAEPEDTVAAAPLDEQAVRHLQEVPGVLLAFPFVTLDVEATCGDTVITTQVRALPQSAFSTQLFKALLDSCRFTSDSAREAIVTREFAEDLGITSFDSLIGETVILSAKVASLDSAVINVIDDNESPIWRRLRGIRFDSLFDAVYREQVMRKELNEAARRFIEGFAERQIEVVDTLTIIGVGADYNIRRVRLAPVILPEQVARRISSSGFQMGNDPTTLISAMSGGYIFTPEQAADKRSYPQVTLELDPMVAPQKVKDSVEALGFRTVSFALQFEEIQRFFTYYYLGLGAVGLIALVTAALGIANTMIMSVIERRREIGVIMSLGADARKLRLMFLVEAAVVGAIGAILGIALGWAGTRVMSIAARTYVESEGMTYVEPFALPLWLIAVAFVFGVLISTIAGLYPAVRASKVDPVQALRGD